MTVIEKKEFKAKIKNRKYIQSRILKIYNNDYVQLRKIFCYMQDEKLKNIKYGNIAINIMNRLLESHSLNYEYFYSEFEQLERLISDIIDNICNNKIN